MKNFVKFFGIIAFVAVIGFTFTACPDSASGANDLTIKGLADYNGKYVIATGRAGVDITKGDELAAAQSLNAEKETFKGVKISNGQAKLKVFKITDDGKKSENFTTNGSTIFGVAIYEKADITEDNIKKPVAAGTVTPSFSNGSAEVTATVVKAP